MDTPEKIAGEMKGGARAMRLAGAGATADKWDSLADRLLALRGEAVAWVRIKNDQYEVRIGGECPHNRGSGHHGPWIQAGKLTYSRPHDSREAGDAALWRAQEAVKEAASAAAKAAFENRYCSNCLKWMDDTHFYASPECIGKSRPELSPAEASAERERRSAIAARGQGES